MHYPVLFEMGVSGVNSKPSISFVPFGELGYCTSAYVMQYTGLKDKNGVEIYESDVVTWIMPQPEYPTGECQVFGVVEFKNGCFCYSMRRKNTVKKEWFNLPMRDESHSKCILTDIGSYGVIGNIYESPQLLDPSPESVRDDLSRDNVIKGGK